MPNPLNFSQQNTWLLPDGVADLMSSEAIKQEALRYQLTQILVNHGYELISPPMIEYTESLLGHASEDVKRQTFKIIDQLTGRLMGVRADITPQIARIDAHLHKPTAQPSIARYCYAGHVIYTMPKGLFGSRTPLQLGAEIFGIDGLASDIELLDILFTLLDSTDLVSRCHIDIGHVAIFTRLCQLAKIPDGLQAQLIELYANKALPELQQLTQEMTAYGEFAQDFYTLCALGNDLTRLSQQLSATAQQDPTIFNALNELQQIIAHLQNRWHANVSVDVTGLGYHYHTGLVFNVYVENEPLPMIRGGRFTNRFHQQAFGQASQAQSNALQAVVRSGVGFSCELNRWQNHIQVHAKPLTVVPFTLVQSVKQSGNTADIEAMEQTIDSLRHEGHRVIVALAEHDQPKDTTHLLQFANGVWYLTHLGEN